MPDTALGPSHELSSLILTASTGCHVPQAGQSKVPVGRVQ